MSRDSASSFSPPFKRFLQSFVRELQRAGAVGAIHADATARTARFRTPGRGDVEIDLDKFYPHYRNAPPAHRGRYLEQLAQHFVRGYADVSRGEGIKQLFPFVNPRLQLPDAGSFLPPERCAPPAGVSRGLTEHLVEQLFLRFGDICSAVQPENLAAWGMTPTEAFEIAVTNLRRQSAAPLRQVSPGLFAGTWEDGRASARLCLPDVVCDLPVRGAPVVAVPTPDTLLVTGTDDLPALNEMVGRIQKRVDAPTLVHFTPVRRQDGVWVPLAVESGHPLEYMITLLQKYGLTTACRQQTGAIYEAALPDLPTATAPPMAWGGDPAAGLPIVTTTVTIGVPTLVPRTDVVCLCRVVSKVEVSIAAVGRWDVVWANIGHRMKPVGGYPERYRLDETPTADEIAAIGLDPAFRPTGGWPERIPLGFSTAQAREMGLPRKVGQILSRYRP